MNVVYIKRTKLSRTEVLLVEAIYNASAKFTLKRKMNKFGGFTSVYSFPRLMEQQFWHSCLGQ